MKPALITIGSNVDKEVNLPKTIEVLRETVDIELKAVSHFYRTVAVLSPPSQQSLQQQERSIFYNAAVLVETTLTPIALRNALRAIEAAQGRVRTEDKFAPRPIDLDIALYGQEMHHSELLHIPDPDILCHPHIAVPLADIASDWLYPGEHRTLGQIAKSLFYTEEEIKRV